MFNSLPKPSRLPMYKINKVDALRALTMAAEDNSYEDTYAVLGELGNTGTHILVNVRTGKIIPKAQNLNEFKPV